MIRHKERFDEMRPAGFDGVFDWDFLIEAFAPTRIQPTDVDFIVERNGYFLVFETKHADNIEVPTGQTSATARPSPAYLRSLGDIPAGVYYIPPPL